MSASTPIFPSELKPWIAMVPPEARVRNPTTATVPPITAKAPVPMLISATSPQHFFRVFANCPRDVSDGAREEDSLSPDVVDRA